MLFKAMVGAGLFALPYAFKLMGFGGGIVAMAIIGGLTWYTNMLIVRVHDVVTRDTFKKDLTYVSLVQHCFGRWGAGIVYALIVFTTIGSLTAYLLFMAQVMNSMLPVLSIIQWAGVLAVVILPLCLVRNSAFLAYTSMMGNIGVVLVVTAVLVRGAQLGTIRSVPDYTDFRSSTFMQAFG
jgi:amino acid permease